LHYIASTFINLADVFIQSDVQMRTIEAVKLGPNSMTTIHKC